MRTLFRRRKNGDNAAREERALQHLGRLTLGVAVSVACLWLATRGTDWSAVGTVLLAANPAWAITGVAGGVLAIAIRAQRWRVLLRPIGAVGFEPSFSATAIGFGATAVLPFRVGEVVRPALLARRTGFSLSATLSTVVLERLFDILLVVACFLAFSLLYAVPPAMRQGALVLAAVAGGGFAVLVVGERRRSATDRVVQLLLRPFPLVLRRAITGVVEGFLRGLAGVNDGRTVLGVLAYSVVLWLCNGLPFMFAMLALGIEAPLVPGALATLVIVAAAVFLPQGPGFVGTWQLGCVTALALFGVPTEQAVGFSILTWLMQMLVSAGTGSICLARQDLSLRQLLRENAAAAPPARGAG